MRRLLRIAFNAFTLLLLLLMVAIIMLWIRSQTHWEWISYEGAGGRQHTATSGLGALVLDVTDGWPATDGPRISRRSDPILDPLQPPPNVWHWHGLGVSRHTMNIGIASSNWVGVSQSTSLTIPYRFVLPLTAALPLARLARVLLRRRKRQAGHCANCGYDLRATPDRCPECGAVSAAVMQ